MKAYLFSLIAAAFAALLVGILAPSGSTGGHIKLMSALVLSILLISPITQALETVIAWGNGDFEIPGIVADEDEEIYREELENATSEASKSYFVQLLTQTLQSKFGLESGSVRCNVLWKTEADEIHPTRVTVILSGSSIWKDPHEISDFVTDLLGCECITAIE